VKEKEEKAGSVKVILKELQRNPRLAGSTPPGTNAKAKLKRKKTDLLK